MNTCPSSLRDPFTVMPTASSGQAPAGFSIQSSVIYKVSCFHSMVQAKISKLFIGGNELHLSFQTRKHTKPQLGESAVYLGGGPKMPHWIPRK